MSSKYDKYSSEQLEVIYTHLTDPDEKELVKKELSARYYRHYLKVGAAGEDQTPTDDSAAPSGPGTAGAGADTDQQAPGIAVEAAAVEDEDLSGLGEIGPIQLTAPAAPKVAPGPAPAPEKTGRWKHCFIATAAYGSPLAREVVLLQNYRDEYLAGTQLGEQFIHTYYRLSPMLARQISRSKVLKLLTRGLLKPLILLITRITGPRRT